MDNDEVVKMVSKITEINDIHDFMNDEDLDQAMAYIIKLIGKPDVPASIAPSLIVKLQAISAKCAIMSRYYTSYQNKGADFVKRKNTYYSAREAIDRLVDALKYSARMGI